MFLDQIIFAGMAIGLFSIVLIAYKRKRTHADNYYIVWILASLPNLLFYTHPEFFPGIGRNFAFTLPVLNTALLYQFVYALTFNNSFKFKHFLLPILPYVWINLLYLIFPNTYILHIPLALVPAVYIILCFILLQRYQKILPTQYSSLEKINLQWLKGILISLIGLFILINLLLKILTKHPDGDWSNRLLVIGTIQGSYLIFIAFFTLRQSILIQQEVFLEPVLINPYPAPKIDQKLIDLSNQLIRYMQEQKPYLDEELSLPRLAQELGCSTNQLSLIFNSHLNCTFYKFVNQYRLEDAKRRLIDPAYDKFSILGIAYDSGFHSKSTFNKIFKEEMGITPSEFKRQFSTEKRPSL